MNLKIVFSALAAIALVGCEKTETKSMTVATPSGSKTVEVEYSYKEKPAFIAKLKDEAKDLNAQMKDLGDKMANSTEDAREKLRTKMDALKEKSKNLDVQIDKAQNATESTWNDVKAGAKNAFEDAKQSFRDAKNWTADKLKQ